MKQDKNAATAKQPRCAALRRNTVQRPRSAPPNLGRGQLARGLAEVRQRASLDARNAALVPIHQQCLNRVRVAGASMGGSVMKMAAAKRVVPVAPYVKFQHMPVQAAESACAGSSRDSPSKAWPTDDGILPSLLLLRGPLQNGRAIGNGLACWERAENCGRCRRPAAPRGPAP